MATCAAAPKGRGAGGHNSGRRLPGRAQRRRGAAAQGDMRR